MNYAKVLRGEFSINFKHIRIAQKSKLIALMKFDVYVIFLTQKSPMNEDEKIMIFWEVIKQWKGFNFSGDGSPSRPEGIS